MKYEPWRKYLVEEIQKRGESWDAIVSIEGEETLNEDVQANPASLKEMQRFFVWTHESVYFPVIDEGVFWVGVVPRNPRPEGE